MCYERRYFVERKIKAGKAYPDLRFQFRLLSLLGAEHKV